MPTVSHAVGLAVVDVAVVDIDGCLTPGEASDWNWGALQAIQELNRRARRGEAVPAVTLCTGRQEPYVEVLMQAIGAYLPGIYENGCGLYFPDGYRFVEHPSITAPVREALTAAKETLQRRVVTPGRGYFQPGKETSLTLFPLPGTSLNCLHKAVVAGLSDYAAVFTAQASVSCVDVIPAGIDKGVGVRWLSEEINIPLARMGGIGDSASDLKFLRLVGQSAAPANAAPEVKAAVGYVSPYENGNGVVDILRRWCGTAPHSRTRGHRRPAASRARHDLHSEVIEFLVSGPTPQAIVAFRPSAEAQTRVAELLEKNRAGMLTADEQAELDQYENLDYLMTLVKARARQRMAATYKQDYQD